VGTVVMASVLFNLLLCFVDTNALRVNALHVILTEAAILAAAFFLPFARNQRSPGRMDVLLILLFATWLLLSILRQDVDPKFFRDVAIIPLFVLLGLAASRGAGLHRRLFWLHMIVLAFAIWEAVSVTSFVRVFAVAEYFENTRGLNVMDWSVDQGLFLSAVRPEQRFLFPDLPVHRLSSVFLEPVSLGNYVVISTIWLAGFWKQIPSRMRLPAVLATVLLLIGSDSRMATVTCTIILLVLPFRRLIFNLAPLLTAPLVILAMCLVVWSLGLQPGTDNFEGRIAHAVSVFGTFKLEDYAGMSLTHIRAAEDAGYAYLVMTQSLLVAAILWTIVFFRKLVTADSRYVHLAIAIYVSLNLTVSWSLFSIKTAAIVWVLLGRSIRDDQEAARLAEPTPATDAGTLPSEPSIRKLAVQRLGAFSSST
jgi:putative polymerase